MTSPAEPRFLRSAAELRRWFARHHASASEQALEAEGRMQDAGRAAFAQRREHKSGVYSFEQDSIELPVEYAKLLEANRKARAHFEARAPSYRKAVPWWIVSAKQEATRVRRLQMLIEHSERGALLYQFSRR
jgi:uncharacterized protein YdeI (YjbR/CyaY-like superfamily)